MLLFETFLSPYALYIALFQRIKPCQQIKHFFTLKFYKNNTMFLSKIPPFTLPPTLYCLFVPLKLSLASLSVFPCCHKSIHMPFF